VTCTVNSGVPGRVPPTVVAVSVLLTAFQL